MIRRSHTSEDGTRSEAVYSPCETYRYRLSRRWGGPDTLLWIMLNPSTADETRNDPTIERCARRAQALGFGGFEVVNLFAFRATAPRDLRRAAEPEGAENAAIVLQAAKTADMVLCGWGVHGEHLAAGPAMASNLRDAGVTLHHLGLTKGGHPRHPLYVGYAVQPQLWAAERG